jgi:SAM-dependent methyltransferase
MPNKNDLESYYKNKYFQTPKGSYESSYTDEELIYFRNKALVALHVLSNNDKITKSLLDIGTGEGFFAKYFYENKWEVRTIDYSNYGMKTQNPELLSTLKQGDMFTLIDEELVQNNSYGFINLSNVVEHVIDPVELLKKIKSILLDDGVVRISVPNDYSNFQKYLLKKGFSTQSWFVPPEHLHYFSFDSLTCLLKHLGYEVFLKISEFPIEIFLVNEPSNYIKNKNVGKQVHLSRIEIDNFLFEEGIEKYINYYKASAEIDFGRQIVIFARKNKGNFK